VTGFHYPSTRLVETHSGQHGPCWRVMETGHPSTRVVETGLNAASAVSIRATISSADIAPHPQRKSHHAARRNTRTQCHTHAGVVVMIPPTSFPSFSITPSHHALLRQKKGQQWNKRSGRKVHSMRGNCCRDFEAGCPSCHQPVLKTSTGTHPFFNHRQTPEGRDVAAFYVCYQMSHDEL